MTTTIGSLCSGYGGLEMGLREALGEGEVVWHAEYDDAPAKILEHHGPTVPNLRDLTTADWTQVAPVDWLTAGYPCQPFSLAGKRKGSSDERHLWPFVARAIGVLRPARVLLENVAGHVSMGLGAVLGDLAALGYDATWGVVRASDAGAPHGRARLFIVAADANRERGHGRRLHGSGQRRGPEPTDGGHAPSDALSAEQSRERLQRPGRTSAAGGGPHAAAHPDGDAVREQPVTLARGRSSALAGLAGLAGSDAPTDADADGDGHGLPQFGRVVNLQRNADRCDRADVAWGAYEPAIRRWEHVTGRPAPRPTEPGRNGPRLAPAFVEWMQGLPAGHVTAVPGLTRSAQLKALGNGVVPQQAALAVRTLLNLESRWAA